MINNEIGRDERIHLNENDVIVNEGQGCDGETMPQTWPHTKSEDLLEDVQATQTKPRKSACSKIQGAIFPIIVLGIILSLVVMLFIINNSSTTSSETEDLIIPYSCSAGCSASLVESIPENLTYPAGSPSYSSTYSVWRELITSANKSITIASMYWTLRNKETGTTTPSASQGEDIFLLLKEAIKRGVEVKIVESKGFKEEVETSLLARWGAQVKRVNFTRLLGNGVLHTKFIISDMMSYYVGSANMDWRSLTQVKEMGVHVSQCQCPIVEDLKKIFDIYWFLGDDNSTIPDTWPQYLDTHYNRSNPLEVDLQGNQSANVFLSSSPAPLCTTSRTSDIDAILSVMEDARRYVDIAVMDYFPTTIYVKPKSKNIYWPNIDDMLKKIAFEKNVRVRLLASFWNHSRPIMLNYLRSLKDFSDKIDVKVFVVPTDEEEALIPYIRVNHNKYMVTDRVAYIGTSNWSGDYFINTAGVGMIFNQSDSSIETTIRKQLTDVFNRDWNSDYSHSVDSTIVVENGEVKITNPSK